MTCISIDLPGLIGSAFVDIHGRFAKHPDELATVRLYYGEGVVIELSAVQFRLLSAAQKLAIEESGSGAGLVATEGKSNA